MRPRFQRSICRRYRGLGVLGFWKTSPGDIMFLEEQTNTGPVDMWMIATRPPISLCSARGQPCWTNGGQAAPDHALAHRVCPPTPGLHPHTHRPTSTINLKYKLQNSNAIGASCPGDEVFSC